MSNPAPDVEDLRGLARGLRLLVEIAALPDAMDGVGADADVTFALTTNRADVLETALADRCGRDDLAIEVPRPDAQRRRRLLLVCARGLAVEADLDEVAAGSEGLTASFMKELIRRSVLVSLRAGERPPVLRGSRRSARRDERRAPRAEPRSARRGHRRRGVHGR